MKYHSDDDGKLYQTKPFYSKPSKFRPKGWTDSKLAYIREARQWTMCVLRNRKYMKRPYTWVVHLNLNEAGFPVDQISPMWKRVVRKLQSRGVVALWVREPNRLNKLHYHILIKNRITIGDLRDAFEESMPPRSLVQWRKRVEPIKHEVRLCYYIFKSKLRGTNEKGVFLEDLYGSKRLLFKASMPFKKVGTIGDFWEQGKSKAKLWNEIIAIEQGIAEGSDKPNVERLAKHVYELLGRCVPLKQIQRSYRFWHDSDGVQNWIQNLTAEEWNGEESISDG